MWNLNKKDLADKKNKEKADGETMKQNKQAKGAKWLRRNVQQSF
jgi:hypothetical protein